jgi:hypothetical protein
LEECFTIEKREMNEDFGGRILGERKGERERDTAVF